MLENTRNKLISTFVIAIVFLIAALCFVFLTDPFKLSALLMILFYLCLAGFSFCLFTIILYLPRSRSVLDGMYAAKMNRSMRQSFWLTILVVVSLILSSYQLLFWWLEAVIILTFIMIEGYFLSSN